MVFNVLITSASRKVNLVQEFKLALKEIGGKVIAVDINPLSPALYFADHYELIPRSDDEIFIPSILEICRKYRIGLIIPTRDEELLIFSANKTLFEKDKITVMVSDLASIKICQNKEEFHIFCEKNGIPVPKRYQLNEKQKKYPLFIKPRIGKGSKDTFLVNTERDLNKIIRQVGTDIVIEEYVNCPEYTVDLFADFYGEIISVIPRKRLLIIAGESYITQTFKDQTIIKASIDLAKKLRLIGHNTIQCFKCEGEIVKFIEVNPRFGGAAHCGFEAGANTPKFLIKLLMGEKLTPQINNFKENLVMLRYTEDYFLEG